MLLSNTAPLQILRARPYGNPDRWREPLKFFPVAFIFGLITTIYLIYVSEHLGPLLADPVPTRQAHGRRCAIAFHAATAMLLICYARCYLTDPGSIPGRQEDPSWALMPQDGRAVEHWAVPEGGASVSFLEAKRSGDRRACKWCNQFKPDRCHHCRVCRRCVLRMDHHCPWIYNCVGFQNHKYFFLLLVYTALDCQLVAWTMLESVRGAISPATPFTRMFLLLFGETLATFLAMLATVFLGFHIWLMLRAMTTIEFCEKSMKRNSYDDSMFDRGPLANVRAVLGEEPLLWLLPVAPPKGTGLAFGKWEGSHLLDGDKGGAPAVWRAAPASGGTGSAPESAAGDNVGDRAAGEGTDPFLQGTDPFLQGTAARAPAAEEAEA